MTFRDAQQAILNAMDGVSLVLGARLCIVQVGTPNWQEFFEQNVSDDAKHLKQTPEAVIGQPITDFFSGERVRSAYATLFQDILKGQRGPFHVDYRCDAPALRRDMRLSIRRIEPGEGGQHELLYQSILLSAEPRAPVSFVEAPIAPADRPSILTLCSICARVAWPVGAQHPDCKWIEAAEYYRRGGDEVPMISHGFCEPCFDKLQGED